MFDPTRWPGSPTAVGALGRGPHGFTGANPFVQGTFTFGPTLDHDRRPVVVVSMCATLERMEHIGIRELRNHTTGAIRRAMAGERIVITIDGVPAAQLGPLNAGDQPATVPDLIAAGLLRAPRAVLPPPPAQPVRAGRSSTEILREHRDR